MKIDPALVSRVASLAALELTDAERDALAGQLTRIVEHFEALRQIPDELLAGVPAPVHATFHADVSRATSRGGVLVTNAAA